MRSGTCCAKADGPDALLRSLFILTADLLKDSSNCSGAEGKIEMTTAVKAMGYVNVRGLWFRQKKLDV